MRSNIIIAGGLLLFAAIVLATWRPVPVSTKQAIVEQGIVTELYEAGVKDLVLKINGKARSYYLDEGLAQGFNLSQLRDKLLNKKVVIKYDKPNSFTTENTTHYISQVRYEDEIILSDVE
jgi:hypothetical protein